MCSHGEKDLLPRLVQLRQIYRCHAKRLYSTAARNDAVDYSNCKSVSMNFFRTCSLFLYDIQRLQNLTQEKKTRKEPRPITQDRIWSGKFDRREIAALEQLFKRRTMPPGGVGPGVVPASAINVGPEAVRYKRVYQCILVNQLLGRG